MPTHIPDILRIENQSLNSKKYTVDHKTEPHFKVYKSSIMIT